MNHRLKNNHLGRKYSHRKALFSNMSVSLIKKKRIFTTLAKAKALKKYIEPIITKSKNNTTNSRRIIFSYLKDKNAVSELFNNTFEKVRNRPGGYTRILKIGFRFGDKSKMSLIEFVDFNEIYKYKIKGKKEKNNINIPSNKRYRTRRRRKKNVNKNNENN
ncbi:50S ribosomal protein L17 [Blattabacterium cuenoti]|uniref:50S ribosomal protein L17 n=1 Tax=Blattabacterium cuenoti TaxID=1653831 RepID=UPI00163C462C|nr:50S ribosomal protein L17 [Blattabacterium cuenoti]